MLSLPSGERRWIDVPVGSTTHQVHAAFWRQHDHGTVGSPLGPVPVVCVHGLGGSHLNWSLLAPHLVAAGLGPVWAPDLAGFGLTPLGQRRSTVGANAALLQAFVETVAAGQPAVIVGNSLGGLLAVRLAARTSSLAKALVLLCPALPQASTRRSFDPLVFAQFSAFALPGVGEAALRHRTRHLTPAQQVVETMRLCSARPGAIDRHVLAAHAELIAHRRGLEYAQRAFLQAARSMLWQLGPQRSAVWRDVARVAVPTLVLYGEADRLVPATAAHRWRRRRPDWTVIVEPDVAHIPMLEEPARVASRVTEWLDLEVSGRAGILQPPVH